MPSSNLKSYNDEKKIHMEMLLDQSTGIKYYPNCCNSTDFTCYIRMDPHHCSKKGYYNSLDTISATFIGLVNVVFRFIKNRNFGVILFFTISFHGAFQENGGPIFFVLLL
jgi:hypothetical protein